MEIDILVKKGGISYISLNMDENIFVLFSEKAKFCIP